MDLWKTWNTRKSIIKKVGYEIAINEAIEIAKKYSYNDTKEFLNGILAKLVRDQKALESV